MESICTICTIKNIKDLKLLLRSLDLIGNRRPVYILCDVATQKQFKSKNNIYFIASLNVPCHTRWNMVKNKIWTDFMLKKCDVIDEALKYHKSTLFVDADIVFLQNFDLRIPDDWILLSPHYIKREYEDRYGKYNWGYIWVSNKNFTSWWKSATKTSNFMEQECLARAIKVFSYKEISIQHNFWWWRLFQVENMIFRKNLFTTWNNIYYDNLELISVHSHFFPTENWSSYVPYNTFILKLLKGSSHPVHKELYKFIISEQGYFFLFYLIYNIFLIGRRNVSKYLTIFVHKYL